MLERENIELETKEKLARENAEREKAKREAAEKVELQKAEQETRKRLAREKAAREKRESDAAEKAKREIKVEPVKKPVVTRSESKKQLTKKLPLWGIGLITFAVLTLIVWGLSSLPVSPEPTQTPSATQTLFIEPVTDTPMRATSTATIIPTPSYGIGSTMIGKDAMTLLYVPAGKFTMGGKAEDALAECQLFSPVSSNCSLDMFKSEEPSHDVSLDAFWIDETEVTNKMYALCVAAGDCQLPKDTNSYSRSDYYGNATYDNFPVIYVDWFMAKAYCEWAGRRLPTEAEWEKAARGTDARLYPWGESLDCSYANYTRNIGGCVGDTTEVGTLEKGQSPYGVNDMAGNVQEWVADWFGWFYYFESLESNPTGLNSGDSRVIRGGSFAWGSGIRSTGRGFGHPEESYESTGFRCAMNATP